jgi:hypothetical protein
VGPPPTVVPSGSIRRFLEQRLQCRVLERLRGLGVVEHLLKGNYPLTVERNYANICSCSARIVNLLIVVHRRNHAARSWSSCGSFPMMTPAWNISGVRGFRLTEPTRLARSALRRERLSATEPRNSVSRGRVRRAAIISIRQPGRSTISPLRRCTSGITQCT